MKRKHIIILIVALIVLAGAGAGVWYWRKKKKEKEQAGSGDLAGKDSLELNPEQQKLRQVQEKAEAEKKKLTNAEQKARTILDSQAKATVKEGINKLIKTSPKVSHQLLKKVTTKAAAQITGDALELQKKRM